MLEDKRSFDEQVQDLAKQYANGKRNALIGATVFGLLTAGIIWYVAKNPDADGVIILLFVGFVGLLATLGAIYEAGCCAVLKDYEPKLLLAKGRYQKSNKFATSCFTSQLKLILFLKSKSPEILTEFMGLGEEPLQPPPDEKKE